MLSSLKVYGSIATSPISESWDQTKISLVEVGEQVMACCWVKGRKMLKKQSWKWKPYKRPRLMWRWIYGFFNLENSMGGNWSSAPNPLMICLSRIHIISGRKKFYTKDMPAIITWQLFFPLSLWNIADLLPARGSEGMHCDLRGTMSRNKHSYPWNCL